MQAWFRNSSIRARLSLLIVTNTSLALLVAGISLFVYEGYQQREAAARELTSEAAIIAESSTADLTFHDEQGGAATLAALRGDARLVEAVIYDKNDRALARYPAVKALKDSRLKAPGVYFDGGSLAIFLPVKLGPERIGTIFLRSTNETGARLRRYVGIVLLVLLLGLALASLASSRMQRTISEPIAELSCLARRISSEKNYSFRALGKSDGEIGTLIDSFNEMLSQIEIHEEARREAEASLRESEERYALAARGANDGLWDWNLRRNEIYYSPRWKQMLGYGDDEIPARPEEWFERIHPSDQKRVQVEIGAHREGLTSEFSSEYRMRHHNGSFIWILTRGLVVRDEDGTAIRMAGSQTDITEGKVADPLTGLPNRLYLLDKLQNALEAYSHRRPLFAVLFLDLDRFKLVNDSLGHAAGDALLTGISGRLISWLEGFRRTSGPQSIAARLGGDEFGILLHGAESTEAVFRFAEGLLKNLELPFHIEGRQVFATVSIGIALSNSAETPEDLVRNADTAMYYAKARGKSRYELFDESMRDRALARMEIEAGLRRAIDGNELMLYYQPQVSLLDQHVLGYEALVRWNHPQRGILGPGEFVPIAEETDLISHLGRWVLREACRQMAAWHQAWPSDPPLSISVNVAARQLNENDFPDFVAHALRESGLNPASLKLEMTESSIMDNPEKAAATLRRLKSMGLGLEIDDFGTGYSSLSYLQRLPFDTVKIDRSFVKELGTGAEASEIVRTILDLARSLDMHVVAEGVETVDQMNSLSALGCDTAQGFLFSKPVTPAAAEAGIEERSRLRSDFARLQNPSDESMPLKNVDELVATPLGV